MQTTGVKPARETLNVNTVHATVSAPGLSAAAEQAASHSIGYGMPCSNCRAYYPADMNACPICKSRERVSPGEVRAAVPASASAKAASTQPNAEVAKLLAEERERLRQLKSQIYASQPQVPATTFRCALDQNHDGTVEPAAVCHSCYGEARQRSERVEAALRIDAKEAAKIVYEAVWADTSDPDKTYYNAATSLLAELKKRAGLTR
ncbi:MAG: hypothetical protein ACRD4E_09410 [Bryobacteraceae bacterium]